MPKIKTSRVNYPDGWQLIEPTLRDLDAKMRQGLSLSLSLSLSPSLISMCLCYWHTIQFSPLNPLCVYPFVSKKIFFLMQLKMTHMTGRESVKHCGLSFILPTKKVDMSSTCITKGRRFPESCMSFASNRAMLMPISLPSRKRLNVRDYAVLGAYKQEITILGRHACAECQNTSEKRIR